MPDNLTEAEKLILTNALMDLRGEARLYFFQSKNLSNEDSRNTFRGIAFHNQRIANALHSALTILNVRGIGERLCLEVDINLCPIEK